MKKLTKGTVLLFAVLLASIMLLSGCPTPFDFGDATRIDKELTVVAGGNISLSAVLSNVSIGVSPDAKVHLTYYEYERVTYKFMESDDGFISIAQQIHGNSSGEIKDMTVLVPKDLRLGTLSTFATSGDINITGVSPNSVIVTVISGNIILNELSAKGNVSLNATSGSMQFTKLSADGNIDISVFSANVEGSIVGSQDDFTVTSVIDDSRGEGTGTINVETGGIGSKKLNLKTEKGDINISFIE